MKKILIPLTGHDKLGSTQEANGTYAPELTHAINVFLANGIDYDLASIKGGEAPLYGTEVGEDTVNNQILSDRAFQERVNNTIPVSEIDITQYQAVYYPGGFGLLSDLAEDKAFAQLSAQLYESGGILAAVCHGPAALLPIQLSNGEKLLANKSVTGFSREEEVQFGTIDKIPFVLEEKLVESAGKYSNVAPWGEFVITDERLITGQNPASAEAVAKTILQNL